MAITRGAGNLICVGEAEHDADVLLSLSALIKAAALRMVFEGILLKKTLHIKVRVLPASGKTEESYRSFRHSSTNLTRDLQSRVTSEEW